MKNKIKVSELKKMIKENQQMDLDKFETFLLEVEKGVYENFGLPVTAEEPLFPRVHSVNEIHYSFIDEDENEFYGAIHIEEDKVKLYQAIEGEITNEKKVYMDKAELLSSPRYLTTLLTDYLTELSGGEYLDS